MSAPTRRPVVRGWSRAGVVALAAAAVLAPTSAQALPATSPGVPPAGTATTATPGTGRPDTLTFDDTTLDFREVKLQRQLIAAEDALAATEVQRTRLLAHLARVEVTAARATGYAQAMRAQLDGRPVGGLVDAVRGLISSEDTIGELAVQAAQDEQHALSIVAIVKTALAEVDAEADTHRTAIARANRRLAAITERSQAQVAALEAAALAQFSDDYAETDRKQDRRNRKALRSWQRDLIDLGNAGVVPPPAKRLARPGRLDDELEPVRDRKGRTSKGVAEVEDEEGHTLEVLPKETIAAISRALRMVGTPAASLGEITCGSLVAVAWTSEHTTLDAQWQRWQAVPVRDIRKGDVVLLDRAAGDTSGVVVGDGLVVALGPVSGTPAVLPLETENVLGVRRPSLTSPTKLLPVPADLTCDLPADEGTPTANAWAWPLDPGTFSMSARFGEDGPLWSTGVHTGQDFAAARGATVRATRPGTVTVENPDWAGNLVRIDHGTGIESTYAHLDQVLITPGTTVEAGDVIGTVGSRGNSTGPHLHLEVLLDGRPVDPLPLLDPASAAPSDPEGTPAAWSDWDNGEIPTDALCPVVPGSGLLLECSAAVALRLLDVAYAEEFGTSLCLTDAYRSRDAQELLYLTKPSMAAVPGTSQHGWGVAVDLCGGVEEFGTDEHAFVAATGPTYGWFHPTWAGPTGSRPEPWHFEHGGTNR